MPNHDYLSRVELLGRGFAAVGEDVRGHPTCGLVATVGEGATIDARSLVKHAVLPWTVNDGIPARTVGLRDRDGVRAREHEFLKIAARASHD